jgi:replication factor C subunit 3/5
MIDNNIDDLNFNNTVNITKKLNKPWIEKYRPESLDDVKSHEQIILTLKNFIKNKDLPHLLLYGPSGIGKTSIISACAKELYGNNMNIMTLQINVSEERGIEIVRNKILQFVQSKSFIFNDNNKLFKLVILDEADAMTLDAQAMLRRIIEKYTVNARFCLLCNYIKKINLALQSRCTIFKLMPIENNIIEQQLLEIAQKENIILTNKVINTIIDMSNGDFRKMLNILQSCSMISNKITYDIINRSLGMPNEEELNIIYNSLINDDFKKSYYIINNILVSEGFALIDIINLIFKKLLVNLDNNQIKLDTFKKIVKRLSIIENNINNNTNDKKQIFSFIGAFKYF